MLAQLAPERFHLAHRLQPLDDLVEQDLQPLDIDRLGQVVVCAFLHRFNRGLDRTLRGEEQRGGIGTLLLQGAEQREPVHARHHQVGDDNRRPERRHFFERFLAVAGGVGDEAPALDELLQADACGRLVLHDQYTFADGSCIAGGNRRFTHTSGHSAPQPCHFYILGAEPGRCKLND